MVMIEMELRRKFDVFDVTKLILSVLVVYIHCEPLKIYSEFGNLLIQGGLCRIAVPLFFAMSGFFLFRDGLDRLKIIKQMKKMLFLYLIWSAIYFFVKLFFALYLNSITADFFIEEVWNTIFIAEHYHFWYILALIYALLIFYIVSILGAYHYTNKTLMIIVGVLWIIGCLHYTYNWIGGFSHSYFDSLTYKFEGVFNAFFIALPLLLVGSLASRYYVQKSKTELLIGIIVSAVLCFFELLVLKFFVPNVKYFNFYLFTPILAFYIICYLLKINFSFANRKISLLFRKMSMFVYCIHPMLIYFWEIYFGTTGLVRFFSVLFGSLFLSLAYYCLIMKRKNT